jgi:polar amino acid transport system substrate-binding protein
MTSVLDRNEGAAEPVWAIGLQFMTFGHIANTINTLKSHIALCLFGFVISHSSLYARSDDEPVTMQVGASIWYPLIYLNKGVPEGSVYEIGNAVLRNAQLDYVLNIRPWSRVYHEGLRNKNYLILGVGRSSKREKLFQWIGPVQQRQEVYYYGLINSPSDIDDMLNNPNVIIAVERNSYTDQYLSEQSFKSKILRVNMTNQLLRLLIEGRVDLILESSDRFNMSVVRLGINPDKYVALKKAFEVTNYMAVSLNTSGAITDKIQKSYDQLIKQGKLVIP